MDKQVIKILSEFLEDDFRIVFLSNEDVFLQLKLFFIHPNEKKYVVSPAFQNLTQLVVNSACYKFLAGVPLHNCFVELDKNEDAGEHPRCRTRSSTN